MGKGHQPIGGTVAQVPLDRADAQAQRYQAVIARQKESINRLLRLLEERTADVTDHMNRANEAATRWHIPEDPIEASSTVASDLYERLATEQFKCANHERTIEALRKSRDEAEQQYQEKVAEIAGLMNELAAAKSEIKNLVALAKTQPVVVDPAEIPPWEKPGFVPPSGTPMPTESAVVPATVDRHTVMQEPNAFPGGHDTETVAFDLAAVGQHDGEQRPGSF